MEMENRTSLIGSEVGSRVIRALRGVERGLNTRANPVIKNTKLLQTKDLLQAFI